MKKPLKFPVMEKLEDKKIGEIKYLKSILQNLKNKDNSHYLHNLTDNYYTNQHGYNLRSGINNQISQSRKDSK